jgi:hypothetical protein
MKGNIIVVGGTALLAATSAWAADLAGKWIAHIVDAQGQGGSDITLVLNVVDGKLTGTINNSLAPLEVEIKDGKISGDEISFSVLRYYGGAETTVVWKGRISGDEIKFNRTTQGGDVGIVGGGASGTEIVAMRVKSK